MSDFDDFKQLYSLSAKLIDEFDKEQLAEVARMLAFHVADYERRFGKIPNPALLSLLGVVEISDQQAKLLRDGMEILLGYLGAMREGVDSADEGPVALAPLCDC